MAIIGSARIGENGKVTGGQPGDQTASEVSTQNFYVHSKGWYILRPKNPEIASKLAEGMLVACNNQNIGYNQNERLSIIKDGVWSTKKTNADCSSLVRACCIYAGFDPGNFTTSNEVSTLGKCGKFEAKIKYINEASTPLRAGDVLVTCTKGHTVIVLEGTKIVQSGYYPKYNGKSTSIDAVLKEIGVPVEYYGSVANRKEFVKKQGGDYNNYSGAYLQNLYIINLAKAGKLRRV